MIFLQEYPLSVILIRLDNRPAESVWPSNKQITKRSFFTDNHKPASAAVYTADYIQVLSDTSRCTAGYHNMHRSNKPDEIAAVRKRNQIRYMKQSIQGIGMLRNIETCKRYRFKLLFS